MAAQGLALLLLKAHHCSHMHISQLVFFNTYQVLFWQGDWHCHCYEVIKKTEEKMVGI